MRHYNEPQDVLEHIYKGSIVGFCTGSPGKYVLNIFQNEKPKIEKLNPDYAIKLCIKVEDGEIFFRDLYALLRWSEECSDDCKVKIENGNLDVVSVDGYRLALRREAINYANNTEFVVPGKTLSEVLKLLKDSEGEVEICPSRRHILFRIDNYTVISALLEGEFLDYKSALPKDKKTEVTVSTRTMIESVERVSLLITDRLKSPVRCVIGEDTVKLFCTTTMGRATDQISAEISGDQLEIGFNNKYLLDALRAAETDEVRLQLGGPISPMLVLPKEGDAFSFLVLPVRLRSEM